MTGVSGDWLPGLPSTFPEIAYELRRLALELPEGQSLPCISIPEVHVSLRDKTHVRVRVPVPSSLANFHGPKWPALPPFLSDRILDPPDTFLQEFSLDGALQPPQTSFLPEPSKRLISPGLTWTLDSPCSVSWVIFLYLVFRIALKGSNCLSEAHISQGPGPPFRSLCVFSLCLSCLAYASSCVANRTNECSLGMSSSPVPSSKFFLFLLGLIEIYLFLKVLPFSMGRATILVIMPFVGLRIST